MNWRTSLQSSDFVSCVISQKVELGNFQRYKLYAVKISESWFSGLVVVTGDQNLIIQAAAQYILINPLNKFQDRLTARFQYTKLDENGRVKFIIGQK